MLLSLIARYFLIVCFMCLTLSHAGAAQLDPRIQEVLHFWLGDLQSPEDYPRKKSKMWFSENPEVGGDIAARFEGLVADAAQGKLDAWQNTPRGRLALIILFDQFPRYMHQRDSSVFESDVIALKLTLDGLRLKHDEVLYPVERLFFYSPLKHAENLTIQKLSVTKFEELAAEAPIKLMRIFQNYAEQAWENYEIIEKCKRFPQHN